MMEDWLRPGERLDDLCRDGMKILQRPDGFRFGMDSVLLASFAASRPGRYRAADLGTGSAVLPLLICARLPGVTFDAIEIQPDVADMASRSIRLNHLEERIAVHAMDLRDAPRVLGHERHALVVANPPYTEKDGGLPSENPAHATARHEGTANLADLCQCAFALLQNGGRMAVVFPAHRLLALCDAMRDARLEPKRVLLVHPAPDKAPNLALVEAVKAAKPMLHFLPPLFVRDGQGRETQALQDMYRA
ncbi:MAG: tRNA1(Val) (adenine(37)-N6)-methyltransferase [Oscillospiraceae bacterium]|jgi:tRNA1Val (adenine37-N6)-methyltransferase|nr:tRNA1(Val) (adenine(37)-N6)-methyltransferase [Oscillospiraceae bacterium]